MTFSLMYMFGLLELLISTESRKALLSGQAEQEESVFLVPLSKNKSIVLLLNQMSDKAAEVKVKSQFETAASEFHRKISNSTLCQSFTELKNDKISVEFTTKPNLPPTARHTQTLDMMTYPKHKLWIGEGQYWRWKLGSLLKRMKTRVDENLEGSSRQIDSPRRNGSLGNKIRSKRAAKRKRHNESKRKRRKKRKQNFDEMEQGGNYFSRDLLKSYLDDGYKVRVYSSDSYDVIFRKGNQSKENKRKHKSHLSLQTRWARELSDALDDGSQRRRYRRHLPQDWQIKIFPQSKQVISVKRRDSVTLSCRSNPCQNGATCLVPENSEQVVCKCLPGFAGDRCETPMRVCLSLPCQNDATCIDRGDSFECFCRPGYFGTFCENDVNECASVPCLNGGRCHDLIGGYRCSCSRKFEGKNCEKRRTSKWFQICESNVCLNGGVCVMRNGAVQCICAKLFTGSRCELSSSSAAAAEKSSSGTGLCEENPCLNGGICKEVGRMKFVCKCPALFLGETCAVRSKPCASHNCAANEVCLEDQSSFTRSYLCQPGGLAGYSNMGNNEGGNKNDTLSYETVLNYNIMRVMGIIVASLLLLSAVCYILCLFIYYNPYDQSSKTEEQLIYQSNLDSKKLSLVATNPSSDR